jgi:hypothetical protein
LPICSKCLTVKSDWCILPPCLLVFMASTSKIGQILPFLIRWIDFGKGTTYSKPQELPNNSCIHKSSSHADCYFVLLIYSFSFCTLLYLCVCVCLCVCVWCVCVCVCGVCVCVCMWCVCVCVCVVCMCVCERERLLSIKSLDLASGIETCVTFWDYQM